VFDLYNFYGVLVGQWCIRVSNGQITIHITSTNHKSFVKLI